MEQNSNKLIIHYKHNFRKLCLFALLCPLICLVVCFVTGLLFQTDDVHETHCQVFNIIPSISAITGISPQRYFWRMSVAVHIGPRFIIAAVYRAYQKNMIDQSSQQHLKKAAEMWLDVAFWLNTIEAASLTGVTYISNRENYPIHEKMFIVFVLSSLCHMLANIYAIKKVAASRNDLESVSEQVKYKKKLFLISILSTIGLVGFFLQHRLLCHRMAFSMFALCEYIIATANVYFHFTIINDFSAEDIIIARELPRNKIE
ncbi:post-GPI attachment to proteins factor 2-like [Aethina tumida]|uniref:post-GPI attachment to proteins factor 2-like n=1 Tax=Aethina tumida TaxID=116153 RepID=UPI0021494DED|nr:post-GPI attachment to proteins factor 2-like [Aethina tumida]